MPCHPLFGTVHSKNTTGTPANESMKGHERTTYTTYTLLKASSFPPRATGSPKTVLALKHVGQLALCGLCVLSSAPIKWSSHIMRLTGQRCHGERSIVWGEGLSRGLGLSVLPPPQARARVYIIVRTFPKNREHSACSTKTYLDTRLSSSDTG
ncbi:hypothetical protein BC826DRAFT_53186 [Russula brevipes]|nr:hypothetical protein BC826DRAFT_53186 [Russula brevipes]